MKLGKTSKVYVCAYRFERASSVWTLNSWPKIVCRFIRRENKHTWWTSWRLLGLFSSHVYPLISHTGIMCIPNWSHGWTVMYTNLIVTRIVYYMHQKQSTAILEYYYQCTCWYLFQKIDLSHISIVKYTYALCKSNLNKKKIEEYSQQ